MVCQDGKKLVCYICGSFDHMLEVSLSSALQYSLTFQSFLIVQGEGQREKREEQVGRGRDEAQVR